MYPAFVRQIADMNRIYQLPDVDKTDGPPMLVRLQQFDSILREECKEIEELMAEAGNATTPEDRLRVITGLADLLGDIVVYCTSEAKRWNIPLDQVLAVIMSSNFSKLGADGKPIKDERGKFLKGPGYWKPEPVIHALVSGNFNIDVNMETHLGDLVYVYVGRETAPAIEAAASQSQQSDSGNQAEVRHP